jgi:hypothetical protein
MPAPFFAPEERNAPIRGEDIKRSRRHSAIDRLRFAGVLVQLYCAVGAKPGKREG